MATKILNRTKSAAGSWTIEIIYVYLWRRYSTPSGLPSKGSISTWINRPLIIWATSRTLLSPVSQIPLKSGARPRTPTLLPFTLFAAVANNSLSQLVSNIAFSCRTSFARMFQSQGSWRVFFLTETEWCWRWPQSPALACWCHGPRVGKCGQTGKWSYEVDSSVAILKQCCEFSASIFFFFQPRVCPIVV